MAGDVRVYSSVPSVDLFVEMGPDMPGGSPIVIDDTTRTMYAYLSGGVTQLGASLPTLAAVATSGAYGDLSGTPTITTVAYGTSSVSIGALVNVGSATMAGSIQYMQVGNIVTLGGQFYMALTAANTATQVRISLPVSNTAFTTTSQGGGAANCTDLQIRGMGAHARSGQQHLMFRGILEVSATGLWDFNATYQVL